VKIKPSGTKRVIKQDIVIPDGFILITDTREQDPLFRKPPKGLLIVRDTLRAGDYSCKGFENAISIERKGLNDFYGSISNGRDRFKRELELLKGYQWAGLVIEADEATVLSANSMYTQMHPLAVKQTIVSIELRYRINIYYSKCRADAERWALDRLIYFYTLKRKGEL